MLLQHDNSSDIILQRVYIIINVSGYKIYKEKSCPQEDFFLLGDESCFIMLWPIRSDINSMHVNQEANEPETRIKYQWCVLFMVVYVQCRFEPAVSRKLK